MTVPEPTTGAGRLFTTEEAAAELGIPAARIRKWKHRGLVVPVSRMRGRGRRGLAPLYRLDDLRVVLARTGADPGAGALRRPLT